MASLTDMSRMVFKQAGPLVIGFALIGLSVLAFQLQLIVFGMGAALAGFGYISVTQYYIKEQLLLKKLAKEQAEEKVAAHVMIGSYNDWTYEKLRKKRIMRALPSVVLTLSAVLGGVALIGLGSTAVVQERFSEQMFLNGVFDLKAIIELDDETTEREQKLQEALEEATPEVAPTVEPK
jgi:hypothetical protein